MADFDLTKAIEWELSVNDRFGTVVFLIKGFPFVGLNVEAAGLFGLGIGGTGEGWAPETLVERVLGAGLLLLMGGAGGIDAVVGDEGGDETFAIVVVVVVETVAKEGGFSLVVVEDSFGVSLFTLTLLLPIGLVLLI